MSVNQFYQSTNSQGVKEVRWHNDNQSVFSKYHRTNVPRDYYLMDIDGIIFAGNQVKAIIEDKDSTNYLLGDVSKSTRKSLEGLAKKLDAAPIMFSRVPHRCITIMDYDDNVASTEYPAEDYQFRHLAADLNGKYVNTANKIYFNYRYSFGRCLPFAIWAVNAPEVESLAIDMAIQCNVKCYRFTSFASLSSQNKATITELTGNCHVSHSVTDDIKSWQAAYRMLKIGITAR